MRVVGLWGVPLTVLCWCAMPAHAQPTPAPTIALRLVYTAPADCPDAASVRARLGSRLSAQAQVHAVRMELRRDGARVVGRLLIDEDARSQRELAGAACEDVVNALALIAALALDGGRAAGPVATPEATPEGAPAPAQQPPAQVPPPIAAPALAPRRALSSERWQWHAMTAGMLSRGISEAPMLAVLAGARVERRRLLHGWLAAAVGSSSSDTSMGQVSFLWTSARGGVCWNLDPEDLWAELCADVDVGRLRVRAEDAVRAVTARRLWLGAGGHVGAAWPKASRAFVQFQAGLLAPLVRDHLYLTPNLTVHTTPAVVPWISVGLGMRFL